MKFSPDIVKKLEIQSRYSKIIVRDFLVLAWIIRDKDQTFTQKTVDKLLRKIQKGRYYKIFPN